MEYFYIDSSHPRYNMPFHWHKEWELIHVLEGTFTAHADDVAYIAHAGDTVLIRDGMLHGGTPEDCVTQNISAVFSSPSHIRRRLNTSICTA